VAGAEARQVLVAGLRQSRKYGCLCPETLARIADWALPRHRTPEAALKAAKRKLHQVYGAYVGQLDLGRVERAIAALGPGADQARLREACRAVLAAHASTAERLPVLERFYADLWSVTGVPQSVLDLACGLSPFALPWMGLPDDAAYTGHDIDERLIALVNHLLASAGRPPTAVCRDLLVSPPAECADAALLLKTAPCLEQQEAGATQRLLQMLRVNWAVVSFPTRSLGGRAKGMVGNYEEFATDLAQRLAVPMQTLMYPSETVYLLALARGPSPAR